MTGKCAFSLDCVQVPRPPPESDSESAHSRSNSGMCHAVLKPKKSIPDPKMFQSLAMTQLSHVPAGCGAVHDGQKPSAKCWKAFLAASQNQD